MRTSHKIVLAGGVLLALALALTPWKTALEGRLSTMLEGQGFSDIKLNLSEIGWRQLTLNDVSIGTVKPMTLKTLLVDYSLVDLWRGSVNQLNFSGLNIVVSQLGEQWVFSGMQANTDRQSPPLRLPVSDASIAGMPFSVAKLDDSQLQVVGEKFQARVPLTLHWQSTPQPKITYRSDMLQFRNMTVEAKTGKATLEATLDSEKHQWNGTWAIADIIFKGIDAPPLKLGGTLVGYADRVVVHGGGHSPDKTYRGEFTLDYSFDDKLASSLTVAHIEMPLAGGRVLLEKARLPLAGKNPAVLELELEHVSIDSVMQGLTGKRATATGALSGKLPVTLTPDGRILFSGGLLAAEAPGKIRLAGDAIPGDNPQVALLREVLADFHYRELTIAMDSAKDGELAATLSVTGSNPAVYNGREVKLNVNLGGDVLAFVQQNLLALTSPQHLLKQGSNAKK